MTTYEYVYGSLDDMVAAADAGVAAGRVRESAAAPATRCIPSAASSATGLT